MTHLVLSQGALLSLINTFDPFQQEDRWDGNALHQHYTNTLFFSDSVTYGPEGLRNFVLTIVFGRTFSL